MANAVLIFQQETLQKVTEEVCSEPPSIRSNATLTASTLKNELFLFGGISQSLLEFTMQAKNSRMRFLRSIMTFLFILPHITDGHDIHHLAHLSPEQATKLPFIR